MKREIELARAREGHTRQLANQLRDARAALADYEERPPTVGSVNSHIRLRNLEHVRDLAETRLMMAQDVSARASEGDGEVGEESEGRERDPEDDGDEGGEGGTPAWPL